MPNDDATRKEKILNTAFELMSKNGIDRTTVRDIAAASGANLASLNYHFGSKDKLVSQMIVFYYSGMWKNFAVLGDKNISVRERLKKFCLNFQEYSLSHAGIQKYLLGQAIQEKEQRPELEENLEKQVRILTEAVGEWCGTGAPEELLYKAVQFKSAIVYPLLMIQYDRILFGRDQPPAEMREKYIDLLIDGLKK